MNRFEKEARAFGYIDGLTSKTANPAFYPPDCRMQYRDGYKDGQAIRAAREGEIQFFPSWCGGANKIKPRLMLAGDIASGDDPEGPFLAEQEQRQLRESAFYFLQYLTATDRMAHAVPDYVLRAFDVAERQVKVLTGIDLASRPDETGL